MENKKIGKIAVGVIGGLLALGGVVVAAVKHGKKNEQEVVENNENETKE